MAATSASPSIDSGQAARGRTRQSRGHDRLAADPIRRRGSPMGADPPLKARTDTTINRRAIDARRLDERSRAWIDALHSGSPRREEAIKRLHTLLLREARFEVGRRTASLSHLSGRDLDDLAMQASNDAVVAILAKLD